MKTPDQIFGELFEAVQLGGVFEDSKTFVDLIPKFPSDKILSDFQNEKTQEGFQLEDFVLKNFNFPPSLAADFKSDTSQKVEVHISKLWKYLTREKDEATEGSSLIPLPHPYIVPGGRFKEIYYWDSYFTMLGLAQDGRVDMIENMVKNFAYLIDTIGHIPNGNRTYFVSRSQPPFFALMVDLLAQLKGEKILEEYLPSLEKEYHFWMRPESHRTTEIEGFVLNRYFDNKNFPREESYAEDVELDGQFPNHYVHLRAACESGWDFSSRWLSDGKNLETIQAADVLPVDLNALLFFLEKIIHRGYTLKGENQQAEKYFHLSEQRKEAMNAIFYNKAINTYADYNFKENKHSTQLTLAMMFPLFFKIADSEQAVSTIQILEEKFIYLGGLPTTLLETSQQWDYPNGWPPMQWISVIGLHNYGFEELARTIADRWCQLVQKVFKKTGKMMEKYNVVDLNLDAGGGEYPVQDGFGWTNGVYLAMQNFLATNDQS